MFIDWKKLAFVRNKIDGRNYLCSCGVTLFWERREKSNTRNLCLRILNRSQECWHIPVIWARGRKRQEDEELEASLGHRVRPCLKRGMGWEDLKHLQQMVSWQRNGAGKCYSDKNGQWKLSEIETEQEGRLLVRNDCVLDFSWVALLPSRSQANPGAAQDSFSEVDVDKYVFLELCVHLSFKT